MLVSCGSVDYQQWNSGTSAFPIPPSHYNPLDEPSPLGLRLRKSPSLLDLIQMKLSQGSGYSAGAAESEGSDAVDKKDSKGIAASSTTDKLKASNFPASLLRIGTWEVSSVTILLLKPKKKGQKTRGKRKNRLFKLFKF